VLRELNSQVTHLSTSDGKSNLYIEQVGKDMGRNNILLLTVNLIKLNAKLRKMIKIRILCDIYYNYINKNKIFKR